MKLRKVTINNYLSLRDVTLSFGDLTVLVGKNGSGKTSILEALYRFFSDFSITGGGVPSGLIDYYWFYRDTREPIRVSVELELNEDDFEKFFQPLPKTVRDVVKDQLGKKSLLLLISREIVSPQIGWKTEYLNWGDIQLVKDDKPVGLDEFSKILIPEKATQDFVLYFFTPQEMAGDRLLVDRSKKVAYYSNPQIDSLVNIGVIKKSREAVGQNYRDWCEQQGFKLIERPPTQEEVPFLMQPITTDLLNNLLANIANNIKGKFRFISAARDEKFTAGMRNPIVDSSMLSSQRALSLSTEREHELKWSTFRNWVERFLERRIDPNPTELLVIENGLRLPVRFLGGGEQEVFALMWQLLDKDFIYGIEEPENHFHPEYLRRLFSFFKEISKERQIILSTHSPLLVDKSNVENNWIIRRERRETEVQRLKEREDLKFVLAELGLVPSDIYLKDFIFFVEGGTEKVAVIPIFGEILGFKDLIERIAIISIGGEGQLKNYLKMWLELLNIFPIEYIVLLDKHSERLIHELIRELKIDIDRFLILNKGSIEDYYPVEIVVKALKELFGIEVTEKDIDPSKPRDKEIERILQEQNKLRRRWKIDIGEYVASQLSEEQIPKEIEMAFEKVKERVSFLPSE
jgi:ABC-type multidrug transport system ATPase subunit